MSRTKYTVTCPECGHDAWGERVDYGHFYTCRGSCRSCGASITIAPDSEHIHIIESENEAHFRGSE